MEYRQLGRTDLQVSRIGMGCVTFGREIDKETSFAIMDHALAQGIDLFDTAAIYGDGSSETVIGRWMAARSSRGKIVLATKVAPPLTREHIHSSVEGSLRRLKTDYVDLIQFHKWDNETPIDESLAALDDLVRAGKARFVGCSNFTATQFSRALRLAEANDWLRLESVQPNYNLVVRDIEAELLPLCVDQQIGVISYSPLGGGFLTGKYSRGGNVPSGTRMDVVPLMQRIYFHETGFRIMEGLRAEATALKVSMPRLALAWVLDQPVITSVLIGARTTRHVDQALSAAAMELPPDLRDKLSKL